MLPPEFAGFRFHRDEAGDDLLLAARTRAATQGPRVIVFGSDRPGLLRALAEHGLAPIVLDSSRTALKRAREELPEDGPFTFLADDPRELRVPGGADLALLPSTQWRAVILVDDRLGILRSLRKVMGPRGAIAIDMARLPSPIPQRDAPGELDAADAQRVTWWHRGRGFDLVTVRVEPQDGDPLEVDFAAGSPERLTMEFGRAGYVRQQVTDAATGSDEILAAAKRLWIVARTGAEEPV